MGDQTLKRDAFYSAISTENMSALWNVLGSLVTPEPKSQCLPGIWRYDEVRARLVEAGSLITAEEAERRVLILENEGLRGQSRITTSLYAGIQAVMPGEVAHAHRHTQSALRLVLEAAGGTTTVNGEEVELRNGDFITTPAWNWHDHANQTDKPVFWLDGLDLAIVSLFDASFLEGLGGKAQEVVHKTGYSNSRYGANMLPVDWRPGTINSPIFCYPYERSRAALDTLLKSSDLDPYHGIKMRYVNPADGQWALPTMGACLQLLPKGFTTGSYRSTDATIFVPVEGRGQSTIRGKTFEWGPRDVFVVPSWYEVTHSVSEDAVLFSYSDRPAQEKLGLWRELRGNERE